jgi:hypothetical protein
LMLTQYSNRFMAASKVLGEETAGSGAAQGQSQGQR